MSVVANYAIEDELSEAVVLRCFKEVGSIAGAAFGRNGFGWLKKNALALNRAAAGIPYVMLTDLDRNLCAPQMVEDWLGDQPCHMNFLLRVAVREVEAWLLADRANLSGLLKVPVDTLPREFETLDDPKQSLLSLARNSRSRRMREDMVAETKHGPVQGPDYNGVLSEFVHNDWDLNADFASCRSLSRMISRLQELARGS